MRDICICVYNEENGFQFMEQEYQISTNFLRYFFMPHGKVCKDGEIYHTYFTLGEDSATQTYIGIHSGSDIEYLDLQYCKLNELYECVEDLGNINYQIKIKGEKLKQVEHRAERNIFKQKIENLTPNTLYSFKLINPAINQTLYQTNYQTLSENDSIKLIEGGDSGVTQRARNLIKQIKNIDPHALIIGGDIAYDDGIRGCYYSWDTFLKMWEQELFLPLNKTIPFIFTLGNHDVGYNAVENVVVKEKPLYFDFFTFSDDNQNYHAHKLGNILLLCLDSGYMAHPSQQKDFIDFYSNKYKNQQKFAVYHVPIYPVCLETDTIWHVDLHSMEAMEENWVKLFEKNKFIGAFENHYHLFKRTYPIKQRQIDHENGVIYFGDGSFGLNPPYTCIEENKRDKTFPIFEKFQYSESDHIWVLESHSDHLKIDSINGYGDDKSTNLQEQEQEQDQSYSIDLDEKITDINRENPINIQKPRVNDYDINNNQCTISIQEQNDTIDYEKQFNIQWAQVCLNRLGYEGDYIDWLDEIYKIEMKKEQLVEIAVELIREMEDLQEIPCENLQIRTHLFKNKKIPQKFLHENSIQSISVNNINEQQPQKKLNPSQSITSINSNEEIKEQKLSSKKMNFEINQNIDQQINIIDNFNQSQKQIFQCEICLEDNLKSSQIFKMVGCQHYCCKVCSIEYLKQLINTSQVMSIKCIQDGCKNIIQQQTVQKVVDEQTYTKYLKFKNRIKHSNDPNVKFCIQPDCEEVVKLGPNNLCQCICGMKFCGRCNGIWHPQKTCEQTIDQEFKEYAKSNIVQNCPKCKSKIEKKSGCNHITCAMCKYEWCWLCRSKYKRGHFQKNNIFGCPGFYSNKKDWPISKIYCYRITNLLKQYRAPRIPGPRITFIQMRQFQEISNLIERGIRGDVDYPEFEPQNLNINNNLRFIPDRQSQSEQINRFHAKFSLRLQQMAINHLGLQNGNNPNQNQFIQNFPQNFQRKNYPTIQFDSPLSSLDKFSEDVEIEMDQDNNLENIKQNEKQISQSQKDIQQDQNFASDIKNIEIKSNLNKFNENNGKNSQILQQKSYGSNKYTQNYNQNNLNDKNRNQQSSQINKLPI
ncbi:hypothetical protein PPERSA_03647 [Pseudocohnilembus persalinus]|uniref:RBR-type E3 ubiquitin transferase n=1 Tax=Pseudocohnilembus persalinus TaxID=266149 RepID=A0A0V0R759_PSEPJ|nr:hypothetical protein PPERSA_03647 [Pseudocohnilembus persalinus]|eukprot:KRX10340.1 hypothetical protein PPERSA_03647 [Pseudocohnilembus persalinus]